MAAAAAAPAYAGPALVVPQLGDHALRRRLRADMIDIQRFITEAEERESLDKDELTADIKDWAERFKVQLNTQADEHQVKRQFIDFLKFQILQDPLTIWLEQIRGIRIENAPLRRTALLGTDHRCYSPELLRLYLLFTTEENRRRSPLNPLDERLFLTRPHPVVLHMMDWLEGYGEAHNSEELDRVYQEQIAGRALPEIPTRHTERRRRMREEEAARQNAIQSQLEAVNRIFANAGAQIARDRDASNNQVNDRIEQVFNGINDRLDAHEDRQQAREQAIEERIDALDANSREIRRETNELQQTLAASDNRLTAVERANAQVKIAINNMIVAHNKKKKNKFKALLKTVAIVAICVVASWAIAEVMAAAAAGAGSAAGAGAGAGAAAGSGTAAGAGASAGAGAAAGSSGASVAITPLRDGARIGAFLRF